MDPKIINKFDIPPVERLSNIINAYIQNNMLKDALDKSNELINLSPNYWEGYALQSHILFLFYKSKPSSDKSLLDITLTLLFKSLYIALQNNNHKIIYKIYFEIALVYKQLKRGAESLSFHRLAIDNFNKADTQLLSKVFYGYAATALLFGDYENGFSYYRYAYVERDTYLRNFPQPFWWGEDCHENGVLYLHNEQAYGDLFFFFRYIPFLKPFFKTIIIEAPSRLLRILKSSPLVINDPQFQFYPKPTHEDEIGNSEVLKLGFNYHTHFALLPGLHRTTYDTVPVSNFPIFKAEGELVDKFRGYFAQFSGKLKVAINWCGKHTNEDEPNRRLPYKLFVDLAKKLADKVQFFSIQKIYELDLIDEKRDNIINLGQYLDNGDDGFVDTAAVMSCVDLVISSDTGIVHVSGGLSVPTWVLIPTWCEWRWGVTGNMSVWYPNNFRLFRHQETDSWEPTFNEVHQELLKLLPA
jgi:hypothetical protein